jgi:hypothetical protein
MASKFSSMAILALLCSCRPVSDEDVNRAPGKSPNHEAPAQATSAGEVAANVHQGEPPGDADFPMIDPPIDPSECSRLSVRDEVQWRRVMMSRLPQDFPGRVPIFQGVERCRHYIVVHFQLDEEGEAKPMREFVLDERARKHIYLGDE